MLPKSYRLGVIWSSLCPVNLPLRQQSVLSELSAGARVGVAYGQSVGKVQSGRRDSEEWCSSAWSDASLCSVGPWWIFSFFFPCFYYCVFLLFVWCCGRFFFLSQGSVFGQQWLLTKKGTRPWWFSLYRYVCDFHKRVQWCSWVNVSDIVHEWTFLQRGWLQENLHTCTHYVCTAKAVDRMFGVPLCFTENVEESVPWVFCRCEKLLPASHQWVLQVFGATGESGLCLTCVFCRCLKQQEKLACVSPVCCAGVWSNRRSGPVSHLCVVQVFGATGEAGLCLTCVLCRCLEQQEKRACVSPVCCHGCSEQQEKLMVCCWACYWCICHQCV